MPRPVDAITKAEWLVHRERLVKFAFYRTRSHERADDLTQEAMRRVVDDNWEPWDPTTHPDIVRYMMSIVNRLIANKRTEAATHREIAMSSAEKSSRAERRAEREADRMPAAQRSPEEAVVAADLASRRITMLRARLAERNDTLALLCLERFMQGIDKPAELALALGTTIAEAIKARDRVFYQAERVARDLGDEEETDEASAKDDAEDAHTNGDASAHDNDAPDSREEVA